MKNWLAVLLGLVICGSGIDSLIGQVLWHTGFEPLPGPNQVALSWGGYPDADVDITDVGSPQGQILRAKLLSGDNWILELNVLFNSPNCSPSYDPSRTILTFDALASMQKPIRICLFYLPSAPGACCDTRLLETYLTPTVAGLWQTYSLTLASFGTSACQIDPRPSDVPWQLQLRLDSDHGWVSDTNGVFMVDNITCEMIPGPAYYPQLSVANSGTNVVLSWPTNASAFLPQETTNLTGGPWSNLTCGTFDLVTNGHNQLVVSRNPGPTYYRLIAP